MFLVQGDTVASVLLAAILESFPVDALELSNKAAGIIVSKVGDLSLSIKKSCLVKSLLIRSRKADYRPMTGTKALPIDKDLAAGGRDCCLYQWLLRYSSCRHAVSAAPPNWKSSDHWCQYRTTSCAVSRDRHVL